MFLAETSVDKHTELFHIIEIASHDHVMVLALQNLAVHREACLMKTVQDSGLIWKEVVVHPYTGVGIHLPETMWGG